MTERPYKAPRFRRERQRVEALPSDIQTTQGVDAGMSIFETQDTAVSLSHVVAAQFAEGQVEAGMGPSPGPLVVGAVEREPALWSEPSAAELGANDNSLEGFSFVEFLNQCDETVDSIEPSQHEPSGQSSNPADAPENLFSDGCSESPVMPDFLEDEEDGLDLGQGDAVQDLMGSVDNFSHVNFDSCVETALMSLPAWAPKPIWEDGVWAAVFGNGLLMDLDFCKPDLTKPTFHPCLSSWLGDIAECSRELKRSSERSRHVKVMQMW